MICAVKLSAPKRVNKTFINGSSIIAPSIFVFFSENHEFRPPNTENFWYFHDFVSITISPRVLSNWFRSFIFGVFFVRFEYTLKYYDGIQQLNLTYPKSYHDYQQIYYRHMCKKIDLERIYGLIWSDIFEAVWGEIIDMRLIVFHALWSKFFLRYEAHFLGDMKRIFYCELRYQANF